MNLPSSPLNRTEWNAELYDRKHGFVSQYGTDLLQLLQPQRGDRILDLGCGTGYLAQQIATVGAEVIGVDQSISMIAQARQSYPHLTFEVKDGEKLDFSEQFDKVFSNAALHWMKAAEKVIEGIFKSLKPGGLFVAEFGGKGNVQQIIQACYSSIESAGYPLDITLNPWYFPSISEYTTLLENRGFEVEFAQLFDRPTPLEDGENGLRNWIAMFGNSLFAEIPPEAQGTILADIETQLSPQLYREETWFADYKRIRVRAKKVG
ncbi:methyltransferase domain-containing protein [Laspinema sp. D1]|uniref:Methyltransferase domain-containing protein n=1 Tax=Laspinema palackyanum D2a TaxID=2953684 RepID=A0ABT2MT37_9CYAN|nr:methyltransferase domain-containing protein [Laspinema sp. D2a]